MTKQKIYFRADASANIGYGHFIRTLALADMLKDDFDCTFYTVSPTKYQVGEMEKVCKFVPLNSDTPLEDFLNLLRGDEIVVLDNYFYTTEYQQKVKSRGCKLVCIDDMHDKYYVADMVINHGLADASDFDTEPYTRLALGSDYALLRSPFLNNTATTKNRGEWTICFGGSDAYNLTLKVASILSSRNDVNYIHAVVGDAFQYRESLSQIEKVIVHSRLSADQMADLFCASESVVCSASSVCYEALFCGCKVFSGYYVDNQKVFYEKLTKKQYILPLGNLIDSELILLKENSSLTTKNVEVVNIKTNYRSLFWQLALRVVDYTQLNESESHLVWEIRNLPEIRIHMANPRPFSFESHQQFIQRLSVDNQKLFYAFFVGNEFVGSFNFTNIGIDSSAERGLFINPSLWGKGLASILEDMIIDKISHYGISYLLAKVLKANIASLTYHYKIGYQLLNEDKDYVYFKKKLIK